MHALLEGHEEAKATGLSQNNPVEQVRDKKWLLRITIISLCTVFFYVTFQPPLCVQ